MSAFTGKDAIQGANDEQGVFRPPDQSSLDQAILFSPDKVFSTGDLPGRRTYNPLGSFSSYTYQLSLYMVTPDAYQAFVLSNRTSFKSFSKFDGKGNLLPTEQQPSTGAFLVAQSGGINRTKDRTIPNPKATGGTTQSGEDVDYYIDNLKFSSATKSDTGGPVNHTKLTFDIIEPYGFSFLTHLAIAFETLRNALDDSKVQKGSSLMGQGVGEFSKQFFILGIRFNGYDAAGLPIKGPAGFMEQYHDIIITSVKFKLNGSSTTYSITGGFPSINGTGPAYGMLNTNTPIISAKTVKDAMGQLETHLNSNENGITYNILFKDKTESLQNASMINPGDRDPNKRGAVNTPQTSSAVNEATADRVQPDTSSRNISLNNGMSITQAMETIVKQSTYITELFDVLNTASLTPNPSTSTKNVVNQHKNPPSARWFNVSTLISDAKWNSKTNNFEYTINYYLGIFETPATFTGYTQASPYHGPFKRYQYWFTGQNREILNYSQTMDNLYFNIILDDAGLVSPLPSGATAVGGQRNPADRTNGMDKSLEKQNAWVTSLYDPAGFAQATITILGDPDLIMNESANPLESAYTLYYNPNGTVNYNTGDVCIEIAFNEGVDYDKSTGLFVINSNIMIGRVNSQIVDNSRMKSSTGVENTNGSVQGANGQEGKVTSGISTSYSNYQNFNKQNNIQGVVFRINSIDSTFKTGQFLQVLHCTLVPEENLNTNLPNLPSNQRTDNQTITPATNTTPTAGGQTAQGSGLAPVPTLTGNPALAAATNGKVSAPSASSSANPRTGGPFVTPSTNGFTPTAPTITSGSLNQSLGLVGPKPNDDAAGSTNTTQAGSVNVPVNTNTIDPTQLSLSERFNKSFPNFNGNRARNR
jgi:hypothetical protein